ncbi:hypothetical protein VTK56DRAFT_5456 [Thermocarpiscus australiensis]
MRLKHLSLLAVARVAWGQTLSDVLQANSANLSTLNGWLASEQLAYTLLSSAQGVTLLAPSNNALNQISGTPLADQLGQDANFLAAFLSYHVLDGVYSIDDFLNADPAATMPTLLDMAAYSNVTGGQRIVANSVDGAVTLLSGNGTQTDVETFDLNYMGGTVHIIDSVLAIPGDLTSTLLDAGLTAAVGAIRRAGVEDSLNLASDMTILVPNNAAFDAIGSLVAGMTAAQLLSVVNYHVIQGKVLYSELIDDGADEMTAASSNVTFRAIDGALFVNSARVVQADLLACNGAIHVLDGVLNPANSTATPNPSAATPEPAFSGASGTGGVPFTSGVLGTPTSAVTLTDNSGPTAAARAPPARTAAVGAAVLFGGAAVLVNL